MVFFDVYRSPQNLKNFFRVSISFLIAVISYTLTGCGGGGSDQSKGYQSSASSDTFQSSASSSVAESIVKLVVQSPSNVVYRNQLFTLDTSQSIDPNHDIYSISVTQTLGAPATPEGEKNKGVFYFSAPNIEGEREETIEFEVKAILNHARGNTISLPITVTIKGYTGPGTMVGQFDPPLHLYRNHPDNYDMSSRFEVFASRIINDTNESEIIFLNHENTGYPTPTSVVEGKFKDIQFLGASRLTFNGLLLNYLRLGYNEFSILSDIDDSLYWYDNSQGLNGANRNQFILKKTISIQNPCYLMGRSDTSQDFIWIGQKDVGMSVVRILPTEPSDGAIALNFQYEIMQTIGTGKSLCHIFPTRLSSQLEPQFTSTPQLSSLITVDTLSNELVLYTDSNTNHIYTELIAIPIETNSTKKLKIVDVMSFGSPSQSPKYLMILMTDGNHEGEHRLIQVKQNREGEISQQVFSWNIGVPATIARGSFHGDDYTRDFVVVIETSEESLFFENITPFYADTALSPELSQPTPFKIGFGASSATTVGRHLWVSYKNTGDVRYFNEQEITHPVVSE